MSTEQGHHLTLRTFAWVREELEAEGPPGPYRIHLPADCRTLEALLARLGEEGGGWQRVLARRAELRFAVNGEILPPRIPPTEVALKTGDEVAVFPPVTGG